jgi:protein-disulfide isomerase
MKRSIVFFAAGIVMCPLLARAQSSNPAPAQPAGSAAKGAAGTGSGSGSMPAATASAIQKHVESFLRNSFAWGPEFTVTVGALKPGPIDGLYEVPVTVTNQGQSDAAVVYVSKNGRYMFRGEVQDLDSNPRAETREEIQLDGYASKGPANAKVEVVEFADFECPSCRQLEYVLRVVLPKYPQVRFVFKDFPLDSIHPWASTAALAGHCALDQSEEIFWKFHDAVYDDQDLISTENASTKLTDIAAAAGADPKTFQSCLADPKTAELVKKSSEEGRKLELTGTPTTFVNGRRIVGPDQSLLEQYIQFDLTPPPNP